MAGLSGACLSLFPTFLVVPDLSSPIPSFPIPSFPNFYSGTQLREKLLLGFFLATETASGESADAVDLNAAPRPLNKSKQSFGRRGVPE